MNHVFAAQEKNINDVVELYKAINTIKVIVKIIDVDIKSFLWSFIQSI